jgi:hypothetical protein
MNIHEIKKAVSEGKTVYWKSKGFQVTSDCKEVFCKVELTGRPLCKSGLLFGGSDNYFTA